MVEKEVKLAKSRPQDAEKLADISKRAYHTDIDCGSPYSKPGGPPGYDSPLAQRRYMLACEYYKILYGGQMVGAVMVKRRAPRVYECTGLFVDPDLHNRGIATQAFELLWEMYPLAKCWRVGTPLWNVRTRYFYEKLGFVLVGTDGRDGALYERTGM